VCPAQPALLHLLLMMQSTLIGCQRPPPTRHVVARHNRCSVLLVPMCALA
jgi:hypothetical protein